MDSTSALDLALAAAKVDTGIKPTIIDQRYSVDQPGGDAAEFFLGKVSDQEALPRMSNAKTEWLPYEDAVRALSLGVLKDGLTQAEHRLRQILPGPFIRHGLEPEFKPVIKRVIDICGPAWQHFENKCQTAKSDEVWFFEDRNLDLKPFMSLHAVEAALDSYFKRMLFLVDEHTLCVADSSSDSRKITAERLKMDWDKVYATVEKRFPLAHRVMAGLAPKAKSWDNGLFDEHRPESGSETADQLRTVMAVYPYKYAMMERHRVVYGMSLDGRVMARGLSLCPDRFREATGTRSLLRNLS